MHRWLFVGRPAQRINPEAVVSERDLFFWNIIYALKKIGPLQATFWIVLRSTYVCILAGRTGHLLHGYRSTLQDHVVSRPFHHTQNNSHEEIVTGPVD